MTWKKSGEEIPTMGQCYGTASGPNYNATSTASKVAGLGGASMSWRDQALRDLYLRSGISPSLDYFRPGWLSSHSRDAGPSLRQAADAPAWRRDWCLGQLSLVGCEASRSLPEMTIEGAVAAMTLRPPAPGAWPWARMIPAAWWRPRRPWRRRLWWDRTPSMSTPMGRCCWRPTANPACATRAAWSIHSTRCCGPVLWAGAVGVSGAPSLGPTDRLG